LCRAYYSAMSDEYQLEPGNIFDRGAYRATLIVRAKRPTGTVREVAYAFAAAFETSSAAMAAARRYALIASLRPHQHVSVADIEFSVQ
jgi:hypothetical protein